MAHILVTITLPGNHDDIRKTPHGSPAFHAVILPRFSDTILLPALPEGKDGKANQKEHRGYGKADQERGYHVAFSS